MQKDIEKVKEFHKKFNLPINELPSFDNVRLLLRAELIEEEAKEFRDSMNVHDMVGIADALADLLYVTLGAAIELGIPLEKVFNEVHRSNMTKLWPDGKPHYDSRGKVLKPDTYSPANISQFL